MVLHPYHPGPERSHTSLFQEAPATFVLSSALRPPPSALIPPLRPPRAVGEATSPGLQSQKPNKRRSIDRVGDLANAACSLPTSKHDDHGRRRGPAAGTADECSPFGGSNALRVRRDLRFRRNSLVCSRRRRLSRRLCRRSPRVCNLFPPPARTLSRVLADGKSSIPRTGTRPEREAEESDATGSFSNSDDHVRHRSSCRWPGIVPTLHGPPALVESRISRIKPRVPFRPDTSRAAGCARHIDLARDSLSHPDQEHPHLQCPSRRCHHRTCGSCEPFSIPPATEGARRMGGQPSRPAA